MSAAWITISPIQLSPGPGGEVVSDRCARNSASVSTGVGLVSAATLRSLNREKLNPALANRARKRGGVIFAVATRCAST